MTIITAKMIVMMMVVLSQLLPWSPGCAMVTKQAVVTKVRLDGRKQTSPWYQVRNSAHGTTIPAREGNGSSELWNTIPHHLQPKNTRQHIHGILRVCTLEKRRRKGKNTHTQRGNRKKRRTNWEEERSQNVRSGRRPSPEDKVAVCWYEQSYQVWYS